ncbi:DUF6191 domain-containing protein [Amycolatopsis benzoatilytica]|uniref:DUF6191 domain-containing protein n=1 Tax=Amycolatopsis benzoatilytica TaxID=346045 RepID=UPI000370840D|nr:DUF6191 domain-containing protein [Amycolatopsis benzoatilytica]
MLTWIGLALPGATILLLIVGGWELRRKNKPSRLKARLSSTYLDEVTAFLYGTKRNELEHRDSVEMTLEEQAQGAPPLGRVDLDRGVVVVRPGASPGRGRFHSAN